MRMRLGLSCAIALGTASPCHADWLPQWMGVWQHPEPFHSALPVDLMPAPDGGLFAVVDTTHHGAAHATLVRFDADGGFDWLREDVAVAVAGGVAVGTDRIAIAGSQAGGASSEVYARVYETGNGDLAHACAWSGVSFEYDGRQQTRAIGADADGTLYVRAYDGGDFVVLRCDADGDTLPAWRWPSGLEDVRTDDLLVLGGGGVLLGGRGTVGNGYFIVRFAADGSATMIDHELGQIGNPLGALHLAEDGNGDFVVAAAPESSFGVPQAQAWKIAPDGERVWTRVIEVPGDAHPNLDVGGFALAPDGDLLLATAPVSGAFRVLRLAGDDGSPRWAATGALEFTPSDLALSPAGRVLVGGYAFIPGGAGHVAARLVEFAADGRPCRKREELGLASALHVIGGSVGWSVVGTDAFSSTSGSEATVQRYDDTGACDDSDVLFADGFEAG